MSCTTCQTCVAFRCLALPQCPADDEVFTLTVGTVDPDTQYTVHVANEANGVVQVVSATSDGAGLLVVDITDLAPYLTDKAVFTLWVTEGQLHENVPFAYGGDEPAECATIRFEKVYDAEGFPYNILDQILIA